MTSSSTTPADPDPSIWLTVERRKQITEKTKSSRSLLIQAGLWQATLGYWVRWQASLEAKWSKEEEKICVDRLVDQWKKENGTNEIYMNGTLDETMLREKIRVAPAVEIWSRENWTQT